MLQLTQLDLFSNVPPFAPALLALPAQEVVSQEPAFALALVPQDTQDSAAAGSAMADEAWLEDLWATAKNGFADKEEWHDEQLVYFFTIREKDALDYPGLQAGSRVKLWEDAEGQLCFKVFNRLQEQKN